MLFRNKINLLFVCLILIVSCSDEETATLGENEESLSYEEKVRLFNESFGSETPPLRAAISYIAEICEDDLYGTANVATFGNSALWDYYSFSGDAGDVVDIEVHRISATMDPAFALYLGTTTDSNGVTIGSGGTNMSFLGWADDNISNPGCFGDPGFFGFVLPATGTYTVAVFDFKNCGGPATYVLQTNGISCVSDMDGDGCIDENDPHPNSDTSPIIWIDGCDTAVANDFVTQCSSMMDLIMDCAESASNHGDFVSCVAALTHEWRRSGLISGREHGKIMQCAGTSNLP